MRSDERDQAQAWAVQYDNGMSLTTASEQVAQRLAEAERQRGHRVTVRRLDDLEAHPRAPEPVPSPQPVPSPERAPSPQRARSPQSAPSPQPARPTEPPRSPEPAGGAPPPAVTRKPGPVRAVTPASRRRLLLYVLAAACIVVAAVLADHWNVLPRIGASSSSAQVSGLLHDPQLLPPLNRPPVMHFGH